MVSQRHKLKSPFKDKSAIYFCTQKKEEVKFLKIRQKGQGSAVQYATLVLVIIAIIISAISLFRVSGVEVPQNLATNEDISSLNEEIQGIKSSIQELRTNQSSILDKIGVKAPARLSVTSISAPTVNHLSPHQL
ncbi:hypothetical protein AKJ62_00255 [candidate division MSBL1 archaeon SCGC-AAA259D14]|uniref:Uncharacterized protein n=1 Tax=candidate division MSBL1 archaeon SCGC-AAA259D14 TaxID=1698261 RepID=A0A133U8Y9_9EURY|nr:hypothetical protein AKJ62_00255 [candidate division MSBL1 archaeon SCGC-AAA259D14]